MSAVCLLGDAAWLCTSSSVLGLIVHIHKVLNSFFWQTSCILKVEERSPGVYQALRQAPHWRCCLLNGLSVKSYLKPNACTVYWRMEALLLLAHASYWKTVLTLFPS